jgi:hypothetical protein
MKPCVATCPGQASVTRSWLDLLPTSPGGISAGVMKRLVPGLLDAAPAREDLRAFPRFTASPGKGRLPTATHLPRISQMDRHPARLVRRFRERGQHVRPSQMAPSCRTQRVKPDRAAFHPFKSLNWPSKAVRRPTKREPIWRIWIYYSSQQRSIDTIDCALILSFGGPLCKSHLLLQT